MNVVLGEATRGNSTRRRSRRKQLVRVNELAGERAGESDLATTTTYYVLYAGVAKRKQTEYGIPFFKPHFSKKQELILESNSFTLVYLARL